MPPMLYLRLFFVPIHAFCLYSTFTPPNSPPPPNEQDNYRSAARKTRFTETGLPLVQTAYALLRVILTIDAIELVALVMLISSPSALPFTDHSRTEAIRRELSAGSTSTCAVAALIFVSTRFRIWSYRVLGRLFTFHLSIREGHKLVTSGPYRVVRHPSYLGAIVVLIGSAWYQLGPSSVWTQLGLWWTTMGRVVGASVVAMSAYVMYGVIERALEEDRVLRGRFGEEWEAWANRTPYRLIPLIY